MARTRKIAPPGTDDPLSGPGVNPAKLKLATTVLAFCVAALLALGMVMLYSSSVGMPQIGATYLVRQLVWCALGLLAGGLAASLDYRIFQKLAWPLLAVTLVLLVLVLIPGIGRGMVKGARRWFDLGVGSFQPSELAKITLIIALAFVI